jgi:hypothetical protein
MGVLRRSGKKSNHHHVNGVTMKIAALQSAVEPIWVATAEQANDRSQSKLCRDERGVRVNFIGMTL